MSYILDALKKAESERHLGAVPTVHAAAPLASHRPGMRGVLVVIALLLAVIVALLLWRTSPAPVPPAAVPSGPPAATVLAAAPAPAATPVPIPAATPAQIPAPAAAPPTPAPPIPSGSTARASVNPASGVAPNTVPAAPVHTTPVPAAALVVTPVPTLAGTPVPATTPAKAPDAADDTLPLAAQLPDSVQRELPNLTVKGYVYSKNPADRILLVGSNLYHEGEEVAPGVRLEKLLPRAAVLNYKSVRFRITY